MKCEKCGAVLCNEEQEWPLCAICANKRVAELEAERANAAKKWKEMEKETRAYRRKIEAENAELRERIEQLKGHIQRHDISEAIPIDVWEAEIDVDLSGSETG